MSLLADADQTAEAGSRRPIPGIRNFWGDFFCSDFLIAQSNEIGPLLICQPNFAMSATKGMGPVRRDVNTAPFYYESRGPFGRGVGQPSANVYKWYPIRRRLSEKKWGAGYVEKKKPIPAVSAAMRREGNDPRFEKHPLFVFWIGVGLPWVRSSGDGPPSCTFNDLLAGFRSALGEIY